jgi:hypothetical protein
MFKASLVASFILAFTGAATLAKTPANHRMYCTQEGATAFRDGDRSNVSAMFKAGHALIREKKCILSHRDAEHDTYAGMVPHEAGNDPAEAPFHVSCKAPTAAVFNEAPDGKAKDSAIARAVLSGQCLLTTPVAEFPAPTNDIFLADLDRVRS